MNLSLPNPVAADYRLALLVATFLVAVHAYRKLSPYFAMTWLGAGLLFGALWGSPSWRLPDAVRPEVVLLPAVLFYLSAAVTKGLVETRDGVRGNHFVHVLMTGVIGGVLALPIEYAGRTAAWQLPSTGVPERNGLDDVVGGLVGAAEEGVIGATELAGVPLAVVAGWAVAATAFYGTYKILDHIGLSKALQCVLLFVAMPFVVQGVEALNALL